MVKEQLKRFSPTFLRWAGLDLLTKPQTETLLHAGQLSRTTEVRVHLPEVRDCASSEKVIFPAKTIRTDPDFVWTLGNPTGQADLLRCGLIRVGKQVLDTDFGNRALLTDLLRPDRRPVQYFPTLIAPWSHYWGGYYDFVLFVAAKLARLRQTLPPEQFRQAAVSYPLFRTAFEQEFLSLLGIDRNRVIDSRQQAISFDRCFVANNSSWFYPSATDLLTLKTTVEAQLQPDPVALGRRLYISRSGRRRVLNEEELTNMLLKHGFEIIPDVPRSVAEQVRLYQSAACIIGPHGASFANLLWCRPGTRLIELFAPSYRPEYFRYLAHTLHLRYEAHSPGPLADSHHANVDANLTVNVADLEQVVRFR